MGRVLKALRCQTLDPSRWELLIVDNASEIPIADQFNAQVPDDARIVVESELGLTPARIAGIKCCTSSVITFVDDDNILSSDYLKKALELSRLWPKIGVWGGQKIPEWEFDPPKWSKPYLGMLSISQFDSERWHNFSRDPAVLPTGAGMCVRREVALEYSNKVKRDPWRRKLDRVGHSLLSCGDFDIAYTAQQIDLGVGLFPDLQLTHIIPRYRTTEPYLLHLREAISLSLELLDIIDGKSIANENKVIFEVLKWVFRYFSMNSLEYKFFRAHWRGVYKARQIYQALDTDLLSLGQITDL